MTSSTSPDAPQEPGTTAAIGVIGGSGFYTWLDDAQPVATERTMLTPFGAPSEPPLVGTVGGVRVAFLPRHGRDHRFLPHRVNYRANLWALRAVGVREVLGPCAVGSLRPELTPGTLVVPDQLIDRTWGRAQTIFDGYAGQSPDGASPTLHIDFADPYCPRGRAAVLDSALAPTTSLGSGTPAAGQPLVDGGTMVVVNGPRFSTRAESRWHAAAGADLVGMTGLPEAAIARELGLCYTSLAVVTDHDAGVEAGDGVTHQEVMAQFARSVEVLKALLATAVVRLDAARPGPSESLGCRCAASVEGLKLPFGD